MLLELDVGNTRVKWRCLSEGRVISGGAFYNQYLLDSEFVSKALAVLDMSLVTGVHVASVVPRYHQALSSWASSVIGVEPVYIEVEREKAGVVNAYRDVSQMGIDRWLALLSAFHYGDVSHESRACLVVSVGSAMTVDLLRGDGVHLGGYIVPGLRMMRDSLFNHTDQVQVSEEPWLSGVAAGTSTHSAVGSGLLLMLLALVDDTYQSLSSRVEECVGVPRLLVAGGDGEYFVEQLCARGLNVAVHVPSLVMDGFRLALPERYSVYGF